MPCGALLFWCYAHTVYRLQGLCHHSCCNPFVNNATYSIKHSCMSKLRLYHRFRLVNCVWCTNNSVYTRTFWTCVSLELPASPTIMYTTDSWQCRLCLSGSCVTNQAVMTTAEKQLEARDISQWHIYALQILHASTYCNGCSQRAASANAHQWHKCFSHHAGGLSWQQAVQMASSQTTNQHCQHILSWQQLCMKLAADKEGTCITWGSHHPPCHQAKAHPVYSSACALESCWRHACSEWRHLSCPEIWKQCHLPAWTGAVYQHQTS